MSFGAPSILLEHLSYSHSLFSSRLSGLIHPAKRDGKKDGRKEITEQRDEMRTKKGKGMRDWTNSVPPMPESWKLQNPSDTKLFHRTISLHSWVTRSWSQQEWISWS